MGYNLLITFDVQIVPDVARGSPFKLAYVSVYVCAVFIKTRLYHSWSNF